MADTDRRRRSLHPGELAALVAGAAVFGWVGWDSALWDARFQLILHLAAAGAIGGLAVMALRGQPLPRTRIDVPVLALVAAFALATVTALNVGLSLRAMASIVATALMLPVALVAIRHRPTWVALFVAIPVLAMSAVSLVALAWRRVEWVLADGPGIPPIRLPAEGSAFGSVAVPPFVIWPAWALAGLIENRGLRRAVQWSLVAVGVPLTILSGSRSAWLAIGVTAVVAGVPWLWSHRARVRRWLRPWPRAVVLVLAGLAVVGGMALVIGPRLTAVTSLLYRASLWRDTLNAWSTDPIFGIGPGLMPYARQAAAPDFSFPVRQPHSHNLPLGVLGDAGVVGLVAGVVLVVAIGWFAGPWRSRTTTGRAAALVLFGLAVSGLFEDLTFLPNFNLIAITLLAVALSDAGAVRWAPVRLRRPVLAVPAAAIAGALLLGMVVADAGAIAYRMGIDAAIEGRWGDATAHLERSTEIDPWHPAGPKSLAVTADAAGMPELAREAAENAVALNPGDGDSWVNLALLCGRLGDQECQLRGTDRAVATAAFLESELVNAAFSYEALGLPDEADAAYRRSLLSQRLTAFATDWPRRVPIGDRELDEVAGVLVELNRLIARDAMGEEVDPETVTDPAARALAHALRGEREEADAWLERAIEQRPDEIPTWDLAIVLRDHWGEPVEWEIGVAEVVRGSSFPEPESEPRPPGITFDIASFRMYPRDELVHDAIRLQSSPPFPWVLAELLP